MAGEHKLKTAPLAVGQVAKRSGVKVSALHFYERKGLIHSHRNTGGQRRYSRDVLRRVSVIKAAQRVGIPLADIADAFAKLPSDRMLTAEDWRQLADRWRGQLNKRIELLSTLRDQLDQCIGCGCLSLSDCPLRNPRDRAGDVGPGARSFDVA